MRCAPRVRSEHQTAREGVDPRGSAPSGFSQLRRVGSGLSASRRAARPRSSPSARTRRRQRAHHAGHASAAGIRRIEALSGPYGRADLHHPHERDVRCSRPASMTLLPVASVHPIHGRPSQRPVWTLVPLGSASCAAVDPRCGRLVAGSCIRCRPELLRRRFGSGSGDGVGRANRAACSRRAPWSLLTWLAVARPIIASHTGPTIPACRCVHIGRWLAGSTTLVATSCGGGR